MKKKLSIVSIIFLIFIIFFIIYIFIEPYLIQICEDEIFDTDIPEEFNGFKIIFIADIHHGPYFSTERVRNVVSTINNIKPDIILLGGDYVHRDKKYINPCFEELSLLKAKYGVFGVLGNHDHWESAELTRFNMKQSGINILDNTGYWIRINTDSIKICGVGDLWEDQQEIEQITENVLIEDFVILVSHNPDFAEELKTNKIDLMLSGHTHGGQVTFFGLWAPFLPSNQKYRTGLVKNDNVTVLITNGIGTITPPVRFFARPQINIIILKNP